LPVELGEDRTDIISRASFELRCPADGLTITLLSTCPNPGYACQVGVDGCDHRLVYQRTQLGWALNSSDAEKKDAEKK
jgi:hypothetical protein